MRLDFQIESRSQALSGLRDSLSRSGEVGTPLGSEIGGIQQSKSDIHHSTAAASDSSPIEKPGASPWWDSRIQDVFDLDPMPLASTARCMLWLAAKTTQPPGNPGPGASLPFGGFAVPRVCCHSAAHQDRQCCEPNATNANSLLMRCLDIHLIGHIEQLSFARVVPIQAPFLEDVEGEIEGAQFEPIKVCKREVRFRLQCKHQACKRLCVVSELFSRLSSKPRYILLPCALQPTLEDAAGTSYFSPVPSGS